MFRDFYTTLAQILPVLLLALVWESRYLEQLRRQQRPSRRMDPVNGYWWTKNRVRIFSLTVVSVIMAEISVTVTVLGGFMNDSGLLRAFLCAGLLVALGALLFRISVDVINATGPSSELAVRNGSADLPDRRRREVGRGVATGNGDHLP